MNQVHARGPQAAGGAAQRLEAVPRQRLKWTNQGDVLIRRHKSRFRPRPTSVGVTDQREQQRVEVCGDAEGVQAEHLASLLQTLVDGGPQARQQNVTLPQAVNVNRKCSEVLREDQLQDRRLQRAATGNQRYRTAVPLRKSKSQRFQCKTSQWDS